MPTMGEVKVETMLSVLTNVSDLAEYNIEISFQKGTYLHDLRNIIVNEARKAKVDYLMFIDSDVAFEYDSIRKLIDHNKDIVGGHYNMKKFPITTTMKPLAEDGKSASTAETYDMPNKLFKCAAVPTGFLLINMKALDSMPRFFDFEYLPNGDLLGEDVWFCNKARELGFDIWCDPTIKIGHVGAYMY